MVAVPPDQEIREDNLESLHVVDIGGERGWPEIFDDLAFDSEVEQANIRLVTVDEIDAMTKARNSRKLPPLDRRSALQGRDGR